jgi:uncharacterized membrane protein (Fun14 family)
MSSPSLFLIIILPCAATAIIGIAVAYSTKNQHIQTIALIIAGICTLILTFLSKGGPFNI